MNNQHILIDNYCSREKPLVSVIVPVYNSSDFILDTINSILAPDDYHIEIVVVDDGSTDNTLDLLDEYCKFNQLIRIISVPNGGVSRARNIGIENAQGEFICFLDSDDQLETEFFSILINNARKNNVDVQLCGYYKHYKNSIDKQPSLYCDDHLLAKYLSGEISFHIGSMIIKKKFIDYHNIRFNEKLFFAEDILFICQLLTLAKCKMSLDYLYHHNYREGSLTTSAWGEKDYLHDIFAMETLSEIIQKSYDGKDKKEIFNLLKNNILDRKLRYIWKLFLNKKYDKLKELYENNFLSKEDCVELNNLSGKYKKRVRIFQLNNITLWKIIRLLNFKKVRLM
ncbi:MULTISPECIES: glycosyltransferase family 2 protein [Providencia]|uniref:Glycosyltransferase family 2 protein n=3 Tax=Providencia huaxiensis TaxID=2027290 RepID=A0A8I2INI6_9GAMM|nr:MULTISPECIES: glycosyltransferase family 2 protein [Providencia]MBQ0269507.1 glycosyltransferase family 2 protein [Providencia huaxiensis]